MKNSLLKFLFFLLTVSLNFSCTTNSVNEKANTFTQEKWSPLDQEEYNLKRQDSSKWFIKYLEVDLSNVQEDTLKVRLPITDYPSPVPLYEKNGSSIWPLRLKINSKAISGYTLSHAKDKYNKHLFKDSIGEFEYKTFFNILFYTDTPLETRNRVISRNYPHYLNVGTQLTSLGKIDWAQMTLANTDNFAIVTQRYFDLNVGKTILVAPYKDGTVRLLQIKDSPGVYTWKEIKSNSVKTIRDFISRIEKNQEAIKFFSHPNIIE